VSLIQNERTKLLANAVDRFSTACLTVGVVTPVAGYFYGLTHLTGWRWVPIFGAWLIVAVGLHYFARGILGNLEE